MRILVVNSNRERSPWPVPPIGACAVASAAEDAGHDVTFVDLCFDKRPSSTLAKAIRRVDPQLIGVSVRNIDSLDWQAEHPFYLDGVKAAVIDVCRRHASCPIVIGGPAVGILPAEVMEYFGVDYAVAGDGETGFIGLIGALESNGPLDRVAGLVYRDAGAIRANGVARICDLDDLPNPRPHQWIDVRRYMAYSGSLGIQTKRGCGLKCSYCTYNAIEGCAYRLKSPERVALEVEEGIRAGATSIEFVDSTFNIPLDHALEVCRILKENRFAARFNTMGINPGAFNEELLAALQEANFTEVSITPESASDVVLKGLGKNFTSADVERAARLSREAHLPVIWYFMFGGPGETAETVRETLDFAEQHIPPEHLVLMVSGIRIFKGAPIEHIARREGQIAPGYNFLNPIWYRPPIPKETLFAMIDEAVEQHPNYISLQDNGIPPAMLRMVTAIHNALGAKRPVWANLRYIRRCQKILGLSPHFMRKLRRAG